jgi:hypothetical protein
MTETYMGPDFRPSDYQRGMIALVGDDDPADVQAGAVAGWLEMLERAGDDLAIRPEPGEWSVLELLGHFVDAEISYAARYRWILAEEGPDIVGFDQDDWVTALHAGPGAPEADADLLLSTFAALRAADIALWTATSDAQRRRVGIHRERGPESYGLQFVLIAGHDRFHLEQARRALAQVRTARR